MRLEFIKTPTKSKDTEEFKAKRRARYAARHADDPMTEHRMRVIKAQKKRERAGLKHGDLTRERRAREQALRDIQEHLMSQQRPFMEVYDYFDKDINEFYTSIDKEFT